VPTGPTAGSETLDVLEFLARVVSHIPDKGQVLQRYYGWYANRTRGIPLGPSTPSVQLDACVSSPIYVFMGVFLSGSGNSVPGKTECVCFQRRTPISFRAPQPSDRTVVDCGRHAPMMPILHRGEIRNGSLRPSGCFVTLGRRFETCTDLTFLLIVGKSVLP
jgi:hypothetical protein